MDVSSSECYTSDTNKLTCDATAELHTGLLGLKSVLISVASPVVEAWTLLFNRVVVPLGQAVSAAARVRVLCAAYYKNKSQQVCPIYETEDRTAHASVWQQIVCSPFCSLTGICSRMSKVLFTNGHTRKRLGEPRNENIRYNWSPKPESKKRSRVCNTSAYNPRISARPSCRCTAGSSRTPVLGPSSSRCRRWTDPWCRGRCIFHL